MLEAYNRVFPNCAEIIVKMAVDQSTHRQDLERTVVRGNVLAERMGQVFAFIPGLIAIGVGVYLIATRQECAGTRRNRGRPRFSRRRFYLGAFATREGARQEAPGTSNRTAPDSF